jgi:uncharacterized protein (DUF1800 family)
MSNFDNNLHLMWRAGFGPAASQLEQLYHIEPQQLFKALQQASDKKPDFIDAADTYLRGLMLGINEVATAKKELEDTDRKVIRQKQRESIKNLNLLWLSKMVDSNAQLREKMALFWHGHFASRNINVFYQQDLLHIIRTHALGNFRDLLHEVSKSAAMLNFLNAAQNRKDHPNENFAREVMELFTLGRGHYNENDIKEAARAFTGWGANLKGEFIFRRFQHDFGSKTIFGKTGVFEGEDVLDMLLEQKQTARFITQKVYKFIVNEHADKDRIEWLASRFYQNNYNISILLEDIFTSNWFYDEKNKGARIKSPVELLAGMQRMLPMDMENEAALLLLQRILGQVLFYPPNVAGWPGGKNWIDSSTLMMRLRIPQMLNDQDELNVQPKDDDDGTMGGQDGGLANNVQERKVPGKAGRSLNVTIHWADYTKNFEHVPRESLLSTMMSSLLLTTSKPSTDVISRYVDSSSRENFIKTATLQLMSTPEYQLC